VKTAYLGLGSNLGDREGLLRSALERLAADDLVVTAVSSVYETAPVGWIDQPDFLNLAAAIRTSLSPRALLEWCLAVEAGLGRVRGERWGPRTIDIDVLWYEGAELQEPALTLPHPRLTERAFALLPLAEIAPALPLGRGTAALLASVLPADGVVRRGALVR
jgi:2-amino-4-hydroxy-6-hydroxymethyldihydropteridine diphosphokinase